jgi:CheY-like chemotaxis protein
MDEALQQPSEVPPPRDRSPFSRRTRVLIVDDMAENRQMLALCCEQFGVSHEWAADGREAVEAAASGRFDLVLMDILMPRMDGITATRAIRALPEPISQTPIIAVTTAAAPGEVVRYLACGMNDVVAKPINAQRLAEAMIGALAPARRRGKAAGRAA